MKSVEGKQRGSEGCSNKRRDESASGLVQGYDPRLGTMRCGT